MKENVLDNNQLNIDWQNNTDMGWAIYRLPESETVYFTTGKVKKLVEIGKFDPSFIIAPFHSIDHSFWQIESTSNYQSDKSLIFENIPDLPFYYNSENAENTTKDDYSSLVQSVLNAINNNELEKAVPARVKHIKSTSIFEPYRFYNTLLEAYPKAFVYMLTTPQTGTWIGCSPELLLRVNDNAISTLSLAGTKKIEDFETKNSKEIFSSKELNEQVIVTNYIRNILEKYTTDISIDGPALITAGNVYHLATNFTGQLNPSLIGDFGSILNELHPTPAVCGFPLRKSLKLLLEHENFDRSLYSGFLGPVTENHADLFVNLRCMQVFANSFSLYAGAGVVIGSDPEKEWFETEEKMNTLLKFI